ncbi:MAG: glycosyltransferase family 4 protein [Chloroflexi bacterium]|nr:glycosyltransferase family 4 protein [Chloroflexota bacterium]
MRIAFFSWESLHSIAVGGGAIHVTELAAALERKGHEVHVFTRIGPGQTHYQRIDGVYYHRCPFDLHPDFVREVGNMCRSFMNHLWQTEDYIGHFDIVHAHDWLTAKALAWAKDGRGKPGVFTVHSTEYGRCGNNHCNGRSETVRSHEWEGCFRADRVIAVSRSLKQEVMNIYGIPDWKIKTIFNGVPVHQFNGWIDPGAVKRRYGIGPLDPTFLYVGRLVLQKGVDLLVEAIPAALRHDSKAKFVFVGDGDMRAGLENRCRQLGISHATRFLGFRNGDTLIDLFKSCDAVVVPSRNEPFGIVILEAWSAGKPVIASVNGGPQEFVWHDVTGYRVYPNPGSIAWGLKAIMGNYEHARWMGRNGRCAAETAFHWDGIGDQVVQVYHEIL